MSLTKRSVKGEMSLERNPNRDPIVAREGPSPLNRKKVRKGEPFLFRRGGRNKIYGPRQHSKYKGKHTLHSKNEKSRQEKEGGSRQTISDREKKTVNYCDRVQTRRGKIHPKGGEEKKGIDRRERKGKCAHRQKDNTVPAEGRIN